MQVQYKHGKKPTAIKFDSGADISSDQSSSPKLELRGSLSSSDKAKKKERTRQHLLWYQTHAFGASFIPAYFELVLEMPVKARVTTSLPTNFSLRASRAIKL